MLIVDKVCLLIVKFFLVFFVCEFGVYRYIYICVCICFRLGWNYFVVVLL